MYASYQQIISFYKSPLLFASLHCCFCCLAGEAFQGVMDGSFPPELLCRGFWCCVFWFFVETSFFCEGIAGTSKSFCALLLERDSQVQLRLIFFC